MYQHCPRKPFIFNQFSNHNRTTKNKLLLIPFTDDEAEAKSEIILLCDTEEPELAPALDHWVTPPLHLDRSQGHKGAHEKDQFGGR